MTNVPYVTRATDVYQAELDAVSAAQTVVATNAQTANYILVLADAGKAVEMSNAGARTITVPPNVDIAFPVGTVVEIARTGAGAVTVLAGAGVTLRSPASLVALNAQYSAGSLRQRAANEWVLSGDLG